nr:calcium-binding protein [uncultured Shinella sp.]
MSFLNKIGGVFTAVTYTHTAGSTTGKINITLQNNASSTLNSHYNKVYFSIKEGWIFDSDDPMINPNILIDSGASDFLGTQMSFSDVYIYNDDSDANSLSWDYLNRKETIRAQYATDVSWKVVVYGAGGDDDIVTGLTKDWVYGGDDNDTINTGFNDDFLFGGSGNDTLIGGIGKDNFVFNTTLSSAGIDIILDFVGADDTIRLDNAVFKAIGANGSLNTDAFLSNSTGVAADNEDRIIYNKSSGLLFYDADGIGNASPICFAILLSKPNITASDFLVI